MTNKINHHGKKHFCQFCLQCFSRSIVLECHTKNCLATNHTKSILLPEEGVCISFWNFKRLAKVQFVIFGDFECALIPTTDNIYFGPNTKKYQDHIVCSYG